MNAIPLTVTTPIRVRKVQGESRSICCKTASTYVGFGVYICPKCGRCYSVRRLWRAH